MFGEIDQTEEDYIDTRIHTTQIMEKAMRAMKCKENGMRKENVITDIFTVGREAAQ